jgi:hypothetical protein
MLNRSQILLSAWAAYRLARLGVFAAGDETGNRHFIRSIFARQLRNAWADAKKADQCAQHALEADEAAHRFLDAQRHARIAQAASWTPETRSLHASSLRDEITLLDYAPWGVRAAERRAALTAELDAIEAVPAAQALAA